jgi:hypothetical protein
LSKGGVRFGKKIAGLHGQAGDGSIGGALPRHRISAVTRAFSSEVGTGSREENATKQGASVLPFQGNGEMR